MISKADVLRTRILDASRREIVLKLEKYDADERYFEVVLEENTLPDATVTSQTGAPKCSNYT